MGPEKTRKAVTRNRARDVANLCLNFLELPARGRGFAALPVDRSRELGLEARERVIDHVRMQDFLLKAGEQLLFKSAARVNKLFLQTRSPR